MTLAKRILRHPATRPVSWLVLTTMLTLTYGVVPPPAGAQVQEARSVAVLEFTNEADARQLLASAARAALELAMTEAGYDVTPRQQVVDSVQLLGLRPPYEPDEIRALADDLDAREVATGRVLRVEQLPGARPTVQVVLQVEIYDGGTGNLINGALVAADETATGTSGAELDQARVEAVSRAITKALREVVNTKLIAGAVLLPDPRDVPPTAETNLGSEDGVVPGMEFDVMRTIVDPLDPARTRRIVIGRVRVNSVDAESARVSLVSGDQGLKTGDFLREVFRLPTLSTVPAIGMGPRTETVSRARGAGASTGLMTGILGTVAGIGILALLLSMQENTNRDGPRVGGAGNAFLRQSVPGDLPAIEINWGDRDFTPPPNFIGGYLVYRSQSEAFAAVENEAVGVVPSADQRRWSDEPRYMNIDQDVQLRYTVQEGTDTETIETTVNVVINKPAPQPGQTYFYKVRRIGPPPVLIPPTLIETGGGGTGGTGGGGGGFGGGGGGFGFRGRDADTGDGATIDMGRLRARQDAMRRGRQQWLREAARGRILRAGGNILSVRTRNTTRTSRTRQTSNIPPGGNYDPDIDTEIDLDEDVGLSNASSAAGPVTYIVPPELRTPADNNQAQQVDDINFEFVGQFGATQYVVQIATDPQFNNLVFQSAPVETTAATVTPFRYDLTQPGFATLSPNSRYFWRVGARSTFRNQRFPEPEGWVFSSVFTFITADQPPPAP